MSILKAKNIYKTFAKVKVLNNISFEVKNKEFLAIIGPLGCGKTTLIKILGGLIKTNRGQVYLNNTLLTKPSVNISHVFQKSNLIPWRTVLKNISLTLEIQKLTKDKINKRSQKLLKLTCLEKFKDSYPAFLSGGMEQLTAIARSFISNAQILLLDEPFAPLDIITREKMNLELLKLWQIEKKTVILVTHSIEEAVFLADRVLVLSSRPGSIKKIININFSRPRSLDIKKMSKFTLLVNKAKKCLNNGMFA